MNFFSTPSSKADEFREVLKSTGDVAYRMALQLTGGREAEARDLVQDAFVKLWNQWDRQKPDSVEGWLYRILHNLYVDGVRKRARFVSLTVETPEGEEGSAWEDRFSDGRPVPLEEAEQSEREKAVHVALNTLPLDFRVPVVLCDMEGLSYEEIAAIVSAPIGTVRSRIHRGRQQLRQALSAYIEGSAPVMEEAADAASAKQAPHAESPALPVIAIGARVYFDEGMVKAS